MWLLAGTVVRPWIFCAAGTLFLDEIGDLSLSSQVKLLRLLQEKEYLPLGLDTARQTDARIIASTHADLWALQEENRFRKDLHYRLQTHRILVPPLRERKGDLALLVDHFLAQASRNLDKPKPPLDPGVLDLINGYAFPGNVRELQAMIFDALAQHTSGALSAGIVEQHITRGRKAEAALSHDRLTSVRLVSELLRDYPDLEDSRRRRFIALILSATDRMIHMVEQMA